MLETVEVFDDLHQPSAVEPRPGFDSRFSKGAAFTMPGGRDIDLHRTFVSGPFGLSVDLGGLFATSTPFVVGGRRLLGLGRTERFLHACYHAALGRGTPRLMTLRDVGQLAQAALAPVDVVRPSPRSGRSAVCATRWRTWPPSFFPGGPEAGDRT